MAKKIIKNLSLVIIPLIITVCVLGLYEQYLDKQILLRYNAELGRTYGVDEMNKGIFLLENNAKKDDLLIIGSSELDAKVPQNPQHMFPNTELNCDVDLVGRASVQSLLDAIKVGALSDSFQGKKVVLVVSLQWFLSSEIDKDGFRANFSEIQFYEMMNNKNISKDSKLYICQRVKTLLKNDSSFSRCYFYADLYEKNSITSNIALKCLQPYYHTRKRFLEIKDKHNALKAVKTYENAVDRDPIKIDWEDEKVKAEQMGMSECTNNSFYVYDEYYTNYLADRMDQLKDCIDPNFDFYVSKEFDDYRLLLDIFNQAGVEPYVILVSTNGYYYDYTGLGREKRVDFYDELCEITEEYGYDYLNLSDEEYTPYFYRDVMHLGWKGWLYVDEQIVKHYSENN